MPLGATVGEGCTFQVALPLMRESAPVAAQR